MKSPTVRVLVVAIAVAAQAGAGYLAWSLDEQMHAERAAIAEFDAQVRRAAQSLAAIGAAQRGYVAEGQNSGRFQTQVTTIMTDAAPKLTELRGAAKTPEAQAAFETAIEAMASFGQADRKARDYVSSGQQLSASDVIFADGQDLVNKAVAAIDDARARETDQRTAVIANARRTQLLYVGGAVGLTLVILLVLVPVPRALDAGDRITREPAGGGLGLSQPAGKAVSADAAKESATGLPSRADQERAGPALSARGQELGMAADVCSSLARVRNLRDLPVLLERVAGVLDAIGVILWITDGPSGPLRPALAHGYAHSTLARMGAIGPDADNATASAFRTRSLQTIPAEPPSGGALVVPLVTAEGCWGAMAIELKKNVEPSDYLRAVATILAAQLATLITPAPAAEALRGAE